MRLQPSRWRAPVAVAAAGGGAGAGRQSVRMPGALPVSLETETTGADERASRPDEGGGSLATVAKAASMKAERAAIEHTLRQVHWNRRKAAQILGVSYKTLLNKIKECGISRA